MRMGVDFLLGLDMAKEDTTKALLREAEAMDTRTTRGDIRGMGDHLAQLAPMGSNHPMAVEATEATKKARSAVATVEEADIARARLLKEVPVGKEWVSRFPWLPPMRFSDYIEDIGLL